MSSTVHRVTINRTKIGGHLISFVKCQVKNPAYGRQSISRPMRIIAPIPQLGGPRIAKNPHFLKDGINHPKRKNSKKSRNMPKIRNMPFDQRYLIHREA